MFEDYSFDQRLLFCRAMANLVAADRKVTDEEQRELESLIAATGLSLGDEKVAKAIEAELVKPGGLTEILKKIEKRPLRTALFRMMIEVACVDGEIAKEERAKILETATAFGLDKSAAGELIEWTLGSITAEKREKEILAKLG